MGFNIDPVLINMAGEISKIVGGGADDKKRSEEILDSKKESLRKLGEALLNNEIDDELFNKELKREMLVVEAELLTNKIMKKASAEKAINKAIKLFVDALKVAGAAI